MERMVVVESLRRQRSVPLALCAERVTPRRPLETPEERGALLSGLVVGFLVGASVVVALL